MKPAIKYLLKNNNVELKESTNNLQSSLFLELYIKIIFFFVWKIKVTALLNKKKTLLVIQCTLRLYYLARILFSTSKKFGVFSLKMKLLYVGYLKPRC